MQLKTAAWRKRSKALASEEQARRAAAAREQAELARVARRGRKERIRNRKGRNRHANAKTSKAEDVAAARASPSHSRPPSRRSGGICGCTWPGQTPRAIAALENLKRICEEHLAGQYRIEVIDLLKNPQLARGDQILAVPTLVRKLPEPVRKIIGDLSNDGTGPRRPGPAAAITGAIHG